MEVLSGWYEIRGGEPVIFLRTRDGVYVVRGFRPYCFVPRRFSDTALRLARTMDEVEPVEVDYVALPKPEEGVSEPESVIALVFRVPKRVAEFRKRARALGIPVYEADVPFVRRYMIDSGTRCATEYPVLYIDIEVDDTKGFPDPQLAERPIISIAAVGSDGRERFFALADYAGASSTLEALKLPERELLQAEARMLRDFLDFAADYGMLVGWNAAKFDFPYLRSRTRRLADAGLLEAVNWDWWRLFDLLEGYVGARMKKPRSTALDYVAQIEELPVRKVERAARVSELPRDKLEEYNVTDARILLELDRKLGITRTFSFVAHHTYVFPDDALKRSVAIDALLLRRFRERGIVLPSKPERTMGREKGRYRGAIVFEPLGRGVYCFVLVCDFSSMYPSIIRSFGISPDAKWGLVPPGEVPIYKAVLDWLVSERKNAKRMRDRFPKGSAEYAKYDAMQLALKILANSFYGVLGYANFRLHDVELAERVTGTGRAIITSVKEYAEKVRGLPIIYGDTDSIFVWFEKLVVPSDVEEALGSEGARLLRYALSELLFGPATIEELAERLEVPVEMLVEPLRFAVERGLVRVGEGGRYELSIDVVRIAEELAEEFTRFARERFGGEHLVIEPKTIYARLFMGEKKKRYAGLVAWEEGKRFVEPEMEVKGFEIVRTDWPPYVQEFQQTLLDRVLRGASDEELAAVYRDYVDALRRGAVPVEKLVISKGLTKSEYRQVPAHAKAAAKLRAAGFEVFVGDKVMFVFAAGGDVVPYEPRSGMFVVPQRVAEKVCRDEAVPAPREGWALIPPTCAARLIDVRKYIEYLSNIYERVAGGKPRIAGPGLLRFAKSRRAAW